MKDQIESSLSSSSLYDAQSESKLENWLAQAENTKLFAAKTKFLHCSSLAKAFLISATRQKTKQPLFVITKDKAEAHTLAEDLQFFLGERQASQIHYFAPLEFDFHRGLLPNPEVLAERNTILFHLLNDPYDRIFVTSLPTLLQKVLPLTEFLRAIRWFSSNEEWNREEVIQYLQGIGYSKQPNTMDPGVFSVRGGVMDVFSPIYERPIRIELFGDLIEEIRFFDPKTQVSQEKIEKVVFVPVQPSVFPEASSIEKVCASIKERLDDLGIPKNQRTEIIEKFLNQKSTPEFSLLFPILSGGSESLFSYFPKDILVFSENPSLLCQVAKEEELPQITKNQELFEKAFHPIAPQNMLFLSSEELQAYLQEHSTYLFESFSKAEEQNQFSFPSSPLHIHEELHATKGNPSLPMLGFTKKCKTWIEEGYQIHIVCHSQVHANRLVSLLSPYHIPTQTMPETTPFFLNVWKSDFQKVTIWQGFVSESLLFPSLRLILMSEEELFGKKKRVRRTSSSSWMSTADPSQILSSFQDLKEGDYVVHKDHGIGKYLGLRSMQFQDTPGDYVLLEYKDQDKLYLPIYRLNVLQKYLSKESGSPILDKLGGDRWTKAKAKARKAAAELAAEFLSIQAKRKLHVAHACTPIGQDYEAFELDFPYDETQDQSKAIQNIMVDLSQSHPMDRLVCGDVGYGKTEVAMRAAYRMLLEGKQVAVLVPTTVLSFQHFESFRTRFQSTPVRLDTLSRLKTEAENKKSIASLKEGKLDLIIGTHRLLSSDVQFRDLGLVIVDEEHRFGVVHKEKLKKLCETVHYLSLTATPIPRTLNMAMAGIKDLSLITTPPPDRLSIRTFVCRSSPEIIVEAITNELARSGQVYFVHNRIESIFRVEEELRTLLPQVRFDVAHGQLEPEILEEKLFRFFQGETQVFISTSIIESGLDVPNANTMIIDDAQNFGLAQLYQLRGRIGRSTKRAYCYLLAPPENQLLADAKDRLQIIQRYSELGSGFTIASHDLELRGAGDLLGEEQSGHLNAVGIDLYFELLEESILALRGQEKQAGVEPEIQLRIPAYFPLDYLPDLSEKIQLYRRLSSAKNEEEISVLENEIRDRFGPLPEEVLNLLGLMQIKLYLKKLHVTHMNCGPKKTSLQFAATTPVDPKRVVELVQKNRFRYSLGSDQKLVFTPQETHWKGQLTEVQQLCDYFKIPF